MSDIVSMFSEKHQQWIAEYAKEDDDHIAQALITRRKFSALYYHMAQAANRAQEAWEGEVGAVSTEDRIALDVLRADYHLTKVAQLLMQGREA